MVQKEAFFGGWEYDDCSGAVRRETVLVLSTSQVLKVRTPYVCSGEIQRWSNFEDLTSNNVCERSQ